MIVRSVKGQRNRHGWFRTLEKWASSHDGQTVSIGDLTEALTRQVRKRFKDCPADGVRHFGELPNRGAFAAGLFWNVLMGHFSNQGHRWKHLKQHQPGPARSVYAMLRKVREMEADPRIGTMVKDWCDRFEAEARTFRNIDKGVRVVNDDGEQWRASEIWLRRA